MLYRVAQRKVFSYIFIIIDDTINFVTKVTREKYVTIVIYNLRAADNL